MNALTNNLVRRSRGMTLVEVMVVMVVLAILVSLVVGVSSYVSDRARRDQTVLTQSVLKKAIEVFRDEKGEYPSSNGTKLEDRCVSLYEQLVDVPKVKAILAELPQQAIAEVPDTGSKKGFMDGYDKPMDYKKNGGIGGVPVVISLGPDGKGSGDNGDDKADDKADNIRSDGRAN
jgi:prepilin-type N-terminal cleavage/methylation domain-containing protein